MYNSFYGDMDKPDVTEEFFTPKESLMNNGLANSMNSSFYSIKGGTANQPLLKYISPVNEIRESISEASINETNDVLTV